jgi:aryl-alcohol dehydrogenase-like predicted oxidoreductase
MGVIIKEALANGRLTDRNVDQTFTDQRQVLESEAKRLETTIDALSLAAVLAQPWVDVVLSGAATIEQLNSNAAAFNVKWDDQVQHRLAGIAETSEAYWAKRATLAWN